MKGSVRLAIAMAAVLGLGIGFHPVGANTGDASASVVSSDEDSMKSLFIKIWGKLRSVSPKSETQADAKEAVATAGIRGNEATDDLLAPYWKDDLSNDAAFQESIDLFAKGNRYAVQGDMEKAIVAFESFLDNYPDSDLIPNAKFALGVAYSQFGEQGQAVRILSAFVEENNAHFLVDDARQLLQLMI